MIDIIRDNTLDNDSRNVGVVEVTFNGEFEIDKFNDYVTKQLDKIRESSKTYDRDIVFKNNPYYKYFKKFKKTYPVMMQYESFINGKEFPMNRILNVIPFLTELETHVLLGAHDADKVEGPIVFYNETEKTPFSGLFNKDAHSYPKDITGKDDKGIIISMIGGADDRTCLHEDTNHLLYLVFGLEDVSNVEKIISRIIERVEILNPNAKIESKII